MNSIRWMGQVSPDIQIAAENLANYFGAHAPSQGLNNGVVAAFQTAWNSAPLAGSGIDVDDDYGPNTQVAFQMALTAENYPFTAPANAYSSVLPKVPGHGKPVGPAPPPSPAIVPPTPGQGGDGWVMPVLIVGAIGTGLYFLFRKKRAAPRSPTVEITSRHNPRRGRGRALLFA